MSVTTRRKQVISQNAKTTTSFKATRISKTTFLITENDSYGEHPFVYAKQHPTSHVLILSDTGCNTPSKKAVKVSNLRQYLETYPNPDLDGEPINPLIKDADGNIAPERKYIIICTHCHYDHIGGVEAFTELDNTSIVASGYDKKFLTKHLDTHFLGGFAKPPMPLPKYTINQWAHDGDGLLGDTTTNDCSVSALWPAFTRDMPTTATKEDLGIRFLTTPGHTPDSLAWYDEADMALYTGDSFYERFCSGDNGADMPIIFPMEGSLVTFVASLRKMLRFVQRENKKAEREAGREDGESEEDVVVVARRVKVGAAHQTFGRDAEEMITEVLELFEDIIKGEVPSFFTYPVRGEDNSLWLDESKAKYKVFMPDRLVDEARKEAMALFRHTDDE